MKKLLFAGAILLIFVSAGPICFGQQKTKTFKVGNVSFKMVYVEGGDTVIGCTSEQDQRLKNCHNMVDGTLWTEPTYVTLDNYWIGETTVTQELWEAVMGSNPSANKDDPKAPVTNVSWDDCFRFIHKINGLTGENFRFPTEAEWEYAARGGIKSQFYRYAGSNDKEEAARKPNELGLLGMTGGLYQWCKNGCRKDDYLEGGKNPEGSQFYDYRVFRGGSYSQLSTRNCAKKDFKTKWNGLRLARSVKQVVVNAE